MDTRNESHAHGHYIWAAPQGFGVAVVRVQPRGPAAWPASGRAARSSSRWHRWSR